MTAFVTDNALKSAYDPSTPLQRNSRKRGIGTLYEAKWFACSAHDFNRLHTNMFDRNKDTMCGRIMKNLSLCKEIVETYKKVGPEVKFTTDLKQSCETRWDSR